MLSFTRLLQALAGGSSGTPIPQAAGLVFKLSADSLALNNNDPVASWTDSINGAVATQATGANQPLFKTAQFGGKPAVRFDGSNDVMQLGRPAALTAAVDSQVYTVVIAARNNVASANKCIFGATAGGNSFFFQQDGTSIGRFNGGSTACAPSNGAGFFVQGTTSITPYTKGSGAGLERSYLQGGCYNSNVITSPGTGANNFSIGAMAAGTLPAGVDIMEILVWNVCLSPTEMLQVQKWMCEKYTQALPWASSTRFIVYDGNSLMAGTGAATLAGKVPYKSSLALGIPYGTWTCTAVGGITVANMQVNIPDWSGIGAMVGLPVRVAAFEFYNSRALGEPACHVSHNAYATAVRAISGTIKLALGTSLSNNTDILATRDSFNTYYDGTNVPTNCDAYMALHLDANIGNNAAYTTNGGPSGGAPDARGLNLWSDGVHLNSAGYAFLEPMITTGLGLIP